MAVKLRLVRIGKKKQPTYRVVAADSRSPRNGRFIEIVGTYAPRGMSSAEPDAVIVIDRAKVDKWLAQGASRPSEWASCSRRRRRAVLRQLRVPRQQRAPNLWLRAPNRPLRAPSNDRRPGAGFRGRRQHR